MTTVHKITLMPALAVALLAGACSRTDRAANGTTAGENTAAAERQRDEYITRMEERAAQLEQRVADLKAQAGSQARVNSIQEDVRELREEIADLRNTRADNWWPATERSIERSRQHIEEDMGRWTGTADRARTDMTRSTPAGDTTHDDTNFAAKRDRFVTRMESDLDALERELENLGSKARSAGREGIDEVRSQLADLRDQLSDLKNVNADDWWDATKRRLDRTAERIEKSIEDLGRDDPKR